ncbi:probable outer membrane protein pmp15 [Dysidea avara]|uniref:probable outer membrane protein pmp15 n=1 Tax=Dysidea avara TaxID=196820 RepID=UPI003326162C
MITAAVLLAYLFCKIEGDSTVMPDTQSWYSDDEDFASGSGGGNERGQDKLSCCVSGNFTFHSIADILNNISSDNTIVNITTDVVLFSNVILEGLENIMIIGHRNPVVKCNDVGAVKFISCKNITIEGIQWEECGSKDYPGIEFYNSSNVSLKTCSFHNLKGRSVLLSEVSGNVYIDNCNFTHKSKYSGHGAAIHYILNTNSSNKHWLVVQNCKFIFNRATQSVVYIDGSGSRIPGHVYLQDNVFVNNTGVPIYISHTNLHIRGSVLFKGNRAKSGGGIYSNNSTVIFYDKSDVNFISNSVRANGGAIYQVYSKIIFEANSVVTFNNKNARNGGAINSNKSHTKFDAINNGGAVHCDETCAILFHKSTIVTFNSNKASSDGGAVYTTRPSHIDKMVEP